MRTTLGYLIMVIGGVLAFGGTVRTFIVLETIGRVLLWGSAAIVGIILLAFGVGVVVTSVEDEDAADPNDALGKTDSRFGRRSQGGD